jgi:DnaJ-domain-containing protein 1
MNSEAIKSWLERKSRRGMRLAALYAAATLIGGAFVLGLTYFFIFVTGKVFLLGAFPLSPFVTAGSALLAMVVTGFIFADAVRARRDDMSFLPSWFLREYISIGPRLILEGWPYVTRVRRFARLDLETCASVLTYLARQGVPTSRDELRRHFPEVQWSRLSDELRLLAGVIFFRPDNLRVILATPLRLELRALLAQSQSAEIPEPEPQAVPIEAPHKLSPAEILGILPAATLAEIKTAYRTRIKECHPDRFANMDEKSRSLAEEWTKSLNAAYEFLTTEARSQSQT